MYYIYSEHCDLQEFIMLWIPIILAVLLVGGVVTHKVAHTNDSVPEQLIESVIKLESGMDVDFSEQDKQIAEEKARHE